MFVENILVEKNLTKKIVETFLSKKHRVEKIGRKKDQTFSIFRLEKKNRPKLFRQTYFFIRIFCKVTRIVSLVS